jgi:hypothetical protein
MINILAISEGERSDNLYDNRIFQNIGILYEINGDTEYESFERLKEETSSCYFISNRLNIDYGLLDKKNISIELDKTYNTKKYTITGINDNYMFPFPVILYDTPDVRSYLQVKYSGYIGELDKLL